MVENESSRKGGDGSSGCLPFLLGVLIGGSCLFPRVCNYQEPEIREIAPNIIELRESGNKITLYEKSPENTKMYIWKND